VPGTPAGPGRYRDHDWWKITLRAVAGTAAVVASFVFLVDLARATGWPGWTAYLLPLSLDALAAAAWRIYVTCGRDRFALWCGIGTTGATLAGNAVSHLIGTGHVAPGWLLVATVGAVPAMSLALVIHLTAPPRLLDAGAASPSPAGSSLVVERDGAGGRGGPRPGGIAAAGRTAGTTSQRSDDQLLAEIRALGLEQVGADKLTEPLGINKTRAVRLRKLLAAELVPASGNGHTDGSTP
jgi:hypothetical protein